MPQAFCPEPAGHGRAEGAHFPSVAQAKTKLRAESPGSRPGSLRRGCESAGLAGPAAPGVRLMKLYFSPTSPYSRKARIVAALTGFGDRIELVATDTNNPEDAIRIKNPLGKIPT